MESAGAVCEPWQTQWRVCGHCVSDTLDVELDEIEGIGEAMLAQQLVELHRLTDELHTVREVVARPFLEDAVTGPRLALLFFIMFHMTLCDESCKMALSAVTLPRLSKSR